MDYLKSQIEEIEQKIKETKLLLDDPQLASLAKEELKSFERQKAELLKTLAKEQATSSEPSAIILEIRAAAGGEEAGLFAADLYRMYSRFAQSKGWKVEQLSLNEGGIGNIKEVVARIQGKEAYNLLKNESGVHRVQRVPLTESGGRIHTSTVTVAILAEITEKEFHLKMDDVKIETFRASGHGGQNVQKVETAVRAIHIPTGISATCQSERSQFQNKERALSILRSRLFSTQKEAEKEGIDLTRKIQIGSGERAEKIRTYNFPQDRVTDHRIAKSWHNLEKILDGDLNPIIQDLQKYLKQG